MRRPAPPGRSLARMLLAACLATGMLHGAEPEHPKEGYPLGIELPAGQGRELVAFACTRCHSLEGVEALKGYWNEQRWRSLVEIMVRNGAKLDSAQMDTVTRYLTRHYGRK